MHIHEKPTCEAGEKDGKMVAGLAAGAHYGHHDHVMAAPQGVPEGQASMPAAQQMASTDQSMSMGVAQEHSMHSMGEDMADPDQGYAKPKGDLPPLPTSAGGIARSMVVRAGLTLDEIRGRSLMIHSGPDDGSKSGPKIACAVID